MMNRNYGKIDGFDSLDEIQEHVLRSILAEGQKCAPRGMRTLELFPVNFTLNNPRKRCVLNPTRRWSLPLALGEFCWHVSGSNHVSFIEYYAPQWKQFAEEDLILGSCYGHRIFRPDVNNESQWRRLITLLRKDPDSRRAVLTFNDPSLALSVHAKDVPCSSTAQFLIRSGELHAFVCMRSNDAIWGLPYDVFFFTMLQELLACELGVELGTYSHFATSLHLYERHFDLANEIIHTSAFGSFEMPRMTDHHQLVDFLALEANLRENWATSRNGDVQLSGYWKGFLSVLEWYSHVKRCGGYSKALLVRKSNAYAELLQNLVQHNTEQAQEPRRLTSL